MTRHTTRILAATLALAATAGAATAHDEKPACDAAAYEMGLKYQQQSAEIDALQRQGYVLARLRLDQAIAAHTGDEKLAIVTDVDETVIDNSALLVRDMQACRDYTTWDTWKDWERSGAPEPIPGAKEFLDYADSKGVAIFYISDRYDENKAATVKTLTDMGMPQVTDASVLLLGPPKQERRASVEAGHKVVLQLGDTLHDFSEAFVSKVPLDEQRKMVDAQADKFGSQWIVFPNATYGTWRKADLTAWDAPIKTD